MLKKSVLENGTHIIFWDFEIKTNYLIPVKKNKKTKPSSNLKKEKEKTRTCRQVDFDVPVDQRLKIKESDKINKYLDLAREQKKKTVEHEGDGDTNCSRCTWNVRKTRRFLLFVRCGGACR